MKQVLVGGKTLDFVVPEYIVVEFTDKGANLSFEHLFEKQIRGKYKIIMEKITDDADPT
jgi:hypothetical protein